LCSGTLDPGIAATKIALIHTALTDSGLELPIYTPAPSKAGENSQASEEIVQAVVEALARRRQGDDTLPQTTVIRGELVEQQSVRPLEKELL
jgi:hypothetical protein